MRTTWREKINRALGDEALLECTLSEEQLDREFDDGYGGSEGAPFTAWTPTRVLFPVVYDGSEWVGSAPRDPTPEAMANPLYHQGGE